MFHNEPYVYVFWGCSLTLCTSSTMYVVLVVAKGNCILSRNIPSEQSFLSNVCEWWAEGLGSRPLELYRSVVSQRLCPLIRWGGSSVDISLFSDVVFCDFQGPKEPCSANQWRRHMSGPSRSKSYGESESVVIAAHNQHMLVCIVKTVTRGWSSVCTAQNTEESII